MKRIVENLALLFFALLLLVLLVLVHRNNTRENNLEGVLTEEELILESEVAHTYLGYKSILAQDSVLSLVQDAEEKTIGYILRSTYLAQNIKGFGGPTPLCVFLDKQARILKVYTLPNAETNSYMKSFIAKNPFQLWEGLAIQEAIDIAPDILSGATLTSTALINTAQVCLQSYSGLKAEKKVSIMPSIANISVVIVFLLALLSFFRPKEMKKYRIGLLLLSVGILGFWQAKVFSLALFYNWLVSGWQIAFWFLILVFVFQVFSLLILGKNFYCNYLCPYGALQELLGKLSKKKIRIPRKAIVFFHHFGGKVLWVCLFILITGFTIDLANIEVFAAFKIGQSSYFVLALFIFFAVFSIYTRRPWCRDFCPTGYIWRILKRSKCKK